MLPWDCNMTTTTAADDLKSFQKNGRDFSSERPLTTETHPEKSRPHGAAVGKEGTFHSKYKPYFLDDFSMDPQLKMVLRTLLEIDDLNVMFAGVPSSGKTSLLFALVREYYGFDAYQSFPENNLLLIHSLKEQGINYYRNEMKTFCQSRSSIHGKKKMIVVDDLDAINHQCQQVFRNYMDKYSNNVHFVCTCSNSQKVIDSIQSRIHILRLEPPSQDQVKDILRDVLKKEGMCMTEEAQNHVLTLSSYNVRETINHLDKLNLLFGSGQELTLDNCKELCSTVSFQQFEAYLNDLRSGEYVVGIYKLNHIYDYGYSVIDILDAFFTFVKATTLLSENEKYQIIPILCKYITYFHNVHEHAIELALFTREVFVVLHP
ncbi:AAA family ATPase [bacterium]|nr:AAA family ATPase [bacterium]